VSPRLPAVRPRQLIRVLQKKGWVQVRTKGSHRYFSHPDHQNLISVPVHPGDLKRGLLAGILKDAGISREEFLRLL
jgi:predicted RNA binding protein YcfA (HicA-like mRNA interferase family)